MGKTLTIVLLLIVALLGLGFGWVSYSAKMDLAKSQSEQASRVVSLENEAARLNEEASAAVAAREREAARAMQAIEAARMAEEQASKAEIARLQLVAQLNNQLEAAAAERLEAEAQAKILADRMAALENARAEAAARMQALENARTDGSPDANSTEGSDLAAKLAEQERQLAQLREENQALNARTQALASKQIAAEEAIMAAGGEFSMGVMEYMTPHARRYAAQMHRARLAGE